MLFLKKEGDTQPPTSSASLEDIRRNRPFDLLLRDLRFIKDRYGIRVKLGQQDNDDITEGKLEHCSSVEAAEAAVILREELIKYPQSFVKNLQLKRARFVKAPFIPLNGTSDKQHLMNGYAYQDGQIYVVHYHDWPHHTRGTIHHEFKHRSNQVARQQLNGLGRLGLWYEEIYRKKWLGDSPPAYLGEAYWKLTPEAISQLDTGGFARIYGRMNYEEDQATIAEALMTNTALYRNTVRHDPRFGVKIQMAMFDYWLRSGGLLNRKFFQDLAAGKVDETYWQSKRQTSFNDLPRFLTRPSVVYLSTALIYVGMALIESSRIKRTSTA